EERFESLAWMVLTTWVERNGTESGLEFARGLARLLPRSAVLREEIAALLTKVYTDRPNLGTMLARTVGAKDLTVEEGLRRADSLLRLAPGSFFRDRRTKAVGRVRGFAADRDALVADVEGGEKAYDCRAAEELLPLPPEDFRVLAAFDGDRVRALAESDPAGLFESLLRAHGPRLSYREARALLNDFVPGAWAGFWNQAGPKIRRSPWIEVSTGAQPTFELRRVPLSHQTRFEREIADAGEGLPRLFVTLDYLAESKEHAAEEPALVGRLAESLRAQAEGPDPALTLATRGVLLQLAKFLPAAAPGADLPIPAGDPAAHLSALPDARLQAAALEWVKRADPAGYAEYCGVALPAVQSEVCESIAKDLRAAGREDLLYAAAKAILAAPARFASALHWLWRDVAAGGLPHDKGGPEPVALLSQVLLQADRASRLTGEERGLFFRLKSALSARDFDAARRVLVATDMAGARRVSDALARCIGFSDDFRGQMTLVLTETHPKLYHQDVPPWEQDDVIYTTAAGLDRKRKELDRLVNVVLPEIATAIGTAAAEGDLSENAEYKGNLERRDRMTERANSLQTELARTRVIQPEMAGTLLVTVGSRVKVRRVADDSLTEFRFLGPWDVDAENGVYSYRAPMALAFMGRRPGNIVAFESEGKVQRFEILEISSAI
ncbi:MAG: GreA/GreB family elongation factor, partial [Planctomycetes bacterium]|nr:GreA/GreB family elongation factor [Planctomycetota bacterium]